MSPGSRLLRSGPALTGESDKTQIACADWLWSEQSLRPSPLDCALLYPEVGGAMEIEGKKESPDQVIVVSEEILSRLRMSPSFLKRFGIRFLLVYSGPEALTLAGA